jgi:hypothetical protein
MVLDAYLHLNRGNEQRVHDLETKKAELIT